MTIRRKPTPRPKRVAPIVLRETDACKRAARTNELDILRDLMLGGRHSRRTIARYGVSLPTADRWLVALWTKIPGVCKVRDGKITWYEYRGGQHADNRIDFGSARPSASRHRR